MKMPRSFGRITRLSSEKLSHFQLLAGTLVVAALLLPSTAAASTIVYTGTTSGAPTWNRPVANDLDPPIELSLDATGVPYDAHEFQIDTSGLYSLFSSTDPVGWDNYLFLYVTGFDALNPLQNVVIGNDDFNFITGESGFNATLATGVNYFLVTTGFADFNSGDFTNTIDLLQAQAVGSDQSGGTSGDPAEAPEPNTFFLFGTGIALAGAWRKRPFRLS